MKMSSMTDGGATLSVPQHFAWLRFVLSMEKRPTCSGLYTDPATFTVPRAMESPILNGSSRKQPSATADSSGSKMARKQSMRLLPSRSIHTFDFFGHSNRHAFMLDYGSEIMAISKAWIHERDLSKIRGSVFHREARCQSYGCHTGESMSRSWRRKIGNRLIGAIGKTDYSGVGHGLMPTVSGSWTR